MKLPFELKKTIQRVAVPACFHLDIPYWAQIVWLSPCHLSSHVVSNRSLSITLWINLTLLLPKSVIFQLGGNFRCSSIDFIQTELALKLVYHTS